MFMRNYKITVSDIMCIWTVLDSNIAQTTTAAENSDLLP